MSSAVLISLAQDDQYFAYNGIVNAGWVPTEEVIRETINERGDEYRLETEGPNMRNRSVLCHLTLTTERWSCQGLRFVGPALSISVAA